MAFYPCLAVPHADILKERAARKMVQSMYSAAQHMPLHGNTTTAPYARHYAMCFGFDHPDGKRRGRGRGRRAAAGGAAPCISIKHPRRKPGITCNSASKPPPLSCAASGALPMSKAYVLQAPLQCALQISTFPPSSTTALLGKPIYVAALVAAWCICANSFLRHAAMPLRPVTGTTVSRDRK